jgi:hypothetical protein
VHWLDREGGLADEAGSWIAAEPMPTPTPDMNTPEGREQQLRTWLNEAEFNFVYNKHFNGYGPLVNLIHPDQTGATITMVRPIFTGETGEGRIDFNYNGIEEIGFVTLKAALLNRPGQVVEFQVLAGSDELESLNLIFQKKTENFSSGAFFLESMDGLLSHLEAGQQLDLWVMLTQPKHRDPAMRCFDDGQCYDHHVLQDRLWFAQEELIREFLAKLQGGAELTPEELTRYKDLIVPACSLGFIEAEE